MKFLFSILAIGVTSAYAQKRQFNFSKSSVGFGRGPSSSGGLGSDPKPPSLPPNFNEVSSISRNAPAAADAESSSGSAFRPSSYQKWVYCNNGWRQVTRNSCPVVFIDPDFSEHQNSAEADMVQ